MTCHIEQFQDLCIAGLYLAREVEFVSNNIFKILNFRKEKVSCKYKALFDKNNGKMITSS